MMLYTILLGGQLLYILVTSIDINIRPTNKETATVNKLNFIPTTETSISYT